MLANYAKKILEDREQGQKIYEKLYEMKVVEDVKSKIKVTKRPFLPKSSQNWPRRFKKQRKIGIRSEL